MDSDPKPDPQPTGEHHGRRRHRRSRGHRSERFRRAWARFGRWAVILAAAVAGGAVTWGAMQLYHQATHPTPEPRLIGTWVSDPDRSIEEIRKTREIPDAAELDMRRRMFKTMITFRPDTITTDVNGELDEPQPYRVVRRTDDGVVLKYWVRATMEEEEVRFTFLAPDQFRLDFPKFGVTEFYRRAP